MHWSDLEHAQPRLARLAQQRLIRPGVVLVATIRQDGTPRISPVEPYVLDGDLWLSMMWRSTKGCGGPRKLGISCATPGSSCTA